MKTIDKIVSKLKGEKFIIDTRISYSYLFSFFLRRIINLLYGFLVFRRPQRCFLHPSSIIKSKNKIRFGNNLNIDRCCYVDALSTEGIMLGKNVSIGKYTMIECTGSLKNIGKGLIVGDNVGLGNRGNYGCAGGITIGSNTIFGADVSFHAENHNYEDKNILIRHQGVNHKGISIGENCWIGAKATFLDGASIGSGSVVAAGAVVRDKFPENSVIGGIPAKVLKNY